MTTSRLSRPSAPRLSNPASLPWAQMTGGTVTYVNNTDGSVDEVHTFTTAGTLTVTQAGYAQVLLVSGGGPHYAGNSQGTGGRVFEGVLPLSAGTQAVVVGAAVTASTNPNLSTRSGSSSLGSYVSYGVNGVGTIGAGGITSSITGTAVAYGMGGDTPTRANTGGGGYDNTNVASAGIVIVRTRITPVSKLPVAPNGWATVSGGTVTEYTKPDGAVMEVHTFTASGTLTVATAGYADVLVVGSGGGGGALWASGGHVNEGLLGLPAGSHSVTVGAATSADTPGRMSRLGSIAVAAGGYKSGQWGSEAFRSVPDAVTGTNTQQAEGHTSDISGTSVTYGYGAFSGSAYTTPGSGGSSSNGKAGIVIVAVQKSAPTASGIVASGGTETTYRGNGTNGVNGQLYKVHTFTASSSLTVTQGGACDVLVVGGGGGGSSNGNGDIVAAGGAGAGAYNYQTSVYLATGLQAVVVGGGGAANYPGSGSYIGGIAAVGGGSGQRVGVNGSGGSGGGADTGRAAGVSLQGAPFGNSGGVASGQGASGGGGAGAVGGSVGSTSGGAGGAGAANSITGSSVTYAGGGGGGAYSGGTGGTAGTGGGGAGGGQNAAGTAGTANRGGGGGGAGGGPSATSPAGGAGGSGIVIVRYPIAG